MEVSHYLLLLFSNPSNHRRYLPEPFIWYVFQSLAEAAYAMEFGPFVNDNGQSLDFEIVHRDIKPANSELKPFPAILCYGALTILVFLGHDSLGEPKFPYYPTPKLGDFGLAINTHRYDKMNPRMYDGMGSRAYRAPVCPHDLYIHDNCHGF